jgi:hypothetical protein
MAATFSIRVVSGNANASGRKLVAMSTCMVIVRNVRNRGILGDN